MSITGWLIRRLLYLSPAYFNLKYKTIGNMFDLNLDVKAKTASFKILLKGETVPVEVKVSGLEFIKEQGEYFVKIDEIESSKPWIKGIIETMLTNNKYKIDEKIYNFIHSVFE